jgi:hypothetical protein
MIIRKSLNFLPNSDTSQNNWNTYQPIILPVINKNNLIIKQKSKGLLKLVFGIVYFLLLVAAITVLVT